jgi:rod shape-determining protein MreB|tara:strand:- start:4957 stop:5325 length:369 start_codon:yes stop_codon:yes gene_type:complete
MTYLYIQVLENKFIIQVLDNNESREIFLPEKNFTTKRLLVGDFSAAQDCLSKAIKRLAPKKLFTRKTAAVVMNPMEMYKGGLSEVEERILNELAFSSGAIKVALHTGATLTAKEAKHKINDL